MSRSGTGPLLIALAAAGLLGCGSEAGAPPGSSLEADSPGAEPDEPPPDAETTARLQQALAAMSSRRWEDVDSILAPLIARPEPPPDATWIAGSAAFELGRYPETVTLLGDAVRRKPALLPNAVALGFAQRELGDFAAAQATFEAIVAARPTAHKAHYGLGLVALDQGQLTEARVRIEAALAIEPDYLKAHAALGRLLFEEGRADEARAELERVVDKWPSNEQALYHLAQVQAALGDQPAADATLARRAEIYSIKEQLGGLAARRRAGEASPASYALEVRLQLDLGDSAEAVRTLGLGLRAFPDAPELMALISAGLVTPAATGVEAGDGEPPEGEALPR